MMTGHVSGDAAGLVLRCCVEMEEHFTHWSDDTLIYLITSLADSGGFSKVLDINLFVSLFMVL